jgi:non-specific serine/threonine protein kinase/serine/threonine-protein kinase
MSEQMSQQSETSVDGRLEPALPDGETVVLGSPDPVAGGSATSETVGPYQLVRVLGYGGMGEVWLAEQKYPVRRSVALKLVKGGLNTREFIARFESERQALALMDHPAIARVFEAGSTPDNRPYFAMEYVAGTPITVYCDEHRLTLRERLDLFIQVCEGIQHAHQKAIMHRDLKPSNILVTEIDSKPVPKIIDFGLAKALTEPLTTDAIFTRIGTVVGTPDYMSPEQADSAGQDVDTRTDVYSLGIVLYELLVGALPVQLNRLSFGDILRKLREEDTPPPSTRVRRLGTDGATNAQNRRTDVRTLARQLRGDLDAITLKATEKDRSKRYATPSELAADITRYLRNQPVSAHAPGLRYRASKYVRRHGIAVSAAAVFVLMLLGFAIAQTVQLRRVTRERDRADRITKFMTEMFNVSDPRLSRGKNVSAREILDKASNEIDTGLGKDPELQAQMMQIMGTVYVQLGLYGRAATLLRRSADTRSRVLGPNDPVTLKTLSSLSWALAKDGHYADAKKLERQVISSQRELLGPEHADTVSSMGTLATILSAENGPHEMFAGDRAKWAEAENLGRESLALARKVFGPEKPRTLTIEQNLAGILESEERFDEAESMQRHLLEAKRRVFGPDHPETITSMNNLGNTLLHEGRNVEAEKLYREALELYRRVLGPNHIFTLRLMNALAAALAEERRYDEAEELDRTALEIERRVLGPHHIAVPETIYNLACIAAQRGNTNEAFSLLTQAVDQVPVESAAMMEKDHALESLRADSRFSALVAYAKNKAAVASRHSAR